MGPKLQPAQYFTLRLINIDLFLNEKKAFPYEGTNYVVAFKRSSLVSVTICLSL